MPENMTYFLERDLLTPTMLETYEQLIVAATYAGFQVLHTPTGPTGYEDVRDQKIQMKLACTPEPKLPLVGPIDAHVTLYRVRAEKTITFEFFIDAHFALVATKEELCVLLLETARDIRALLI